jgi:hypothetical protein
LSANDILQGNYWITAPEFLSTEADDWPETPTKLSDEIQSDDPEVKKAKVSAIVSSSESSLDDDDSNSVYRLINYYSSWYKLKRSIA